MYTEKTSRSGPLKARRLLLIATILLLLAGAGAGLYFWKSKPTTPIAEYPKYLSFSGKYVFSVPKTYILDDQSLPGVQLLYTGKITVNNLADAYSANAVAVQSITDLSDKGDAFKKKINDAFIPELKKLSAETKVKFGSKDGKDFARITVTKDGKPIRFVFVRNGKHPVQIVAKAETSVVKEIEQTIIDVEASELKDEAEPVGKVVDGVAGLIKGQKGAELYQQLAPEFKAKNSQEDLVKTLDDASLYTKAKFVVAGAAYKINPSEFTVVISIAPISKDAEATSGVLYLTKASGEWKVKGLNLPIPNKTSFAPAPPKQS